MGPKNPRSTVLSLNEEKAIIAFRTLTLLPLDDCLYALQGSITHLTRSSLHRCFQRHNVSRFSDVAEGKPEKKAFKNYPIVNSSEFNYFLPSHDTKITTYLTLRIPGLTQGIKPSININHQSFIFSFSLSSISLSKAII